MNTKLLHQLPPSENNPRNSEGSFIRGKQGEILFAYSRYTGEHWGDDCACDIALISSFDEGRTWSEPRIIARAVDFGVKNVMSVSALELSDGRIAFFFLIKIEKDGISTIELGRTVSENGVDFTAERCDMKCAPYYYVVNNDRFVRLSSGRIVAPTAYIHRDLVNKHAYNHFNTYTSSCLYSDDDGKTFYKANFDLRSTFGPNKYTGLQEPGILERDDGLYLWMRTNYGCQYESFSTHGLSGFAEAKPSGFTAPCSPRQIKTFGNVTYAVYNPVPNYNGRHQAPGTMGRTPFVIRKSTDGGKTFGAINTIEDEETRGYSYPAIFATNDGRLLLAYCRGDASDGCQLCRIGICEIEIDSIE